MPAIRNRRDPEPAPEPVRAKPVNTSGVERISVRAVGRRVRILGETAVATLSADGPHVLRRNGPVLEVSSDGELGASLDGFSILRGAPRNLDDIRALGLGKELLLKVNPNIVVDVEVTAGSLHTERVPHLGKVRVTAGGAKLLDVTEINDALIQAGQATIKGAIKTGRNRIRAESGSLSITLADDSNVTIKGESQLGKVSWSGGHSGDVRRGRDGQRQRPARRRGGHGPRPGPGRFRSPGRSGGLVTDRVRRPADVHEHRAPSDCPVCGDQLAVTRLGCPSCGSELAGVFRSCEFCALNTGEIEMLRVFLGSRGNLREVEKHLGVSYPTARLRFAALLTKLGLGDEPEPAG